MAILSSDLIRQGASGATTASYPISQSIRFNDDDSPALKKTYSGAGTEETFTFSCWVKRAGIGAGLGASNLGLTLFSGGPNVSNYGEIVFRSNGYGVQDSLDFYYSKSGSISADLVTTRLFRDPSAWYHIVCVMDTTNNVASERMRIYVNGQRETSFSTETYPSKDAVPDFNTATEHGVGVFAVSTDTRFFDGYLAEIHFLDGYAYDASYFGEFKEDTDIWIPKEYEGSYGTNGFYIDGRDSSDFGDDESGRGNDYSASGLATHDQMLDTPTNNFAVINSIYADDAAAGNALTLAEGNLKATGGGSTFSVKGFTFNLPKSGKWYFEYTIGGTEDGFGYVIEGEQTTIQAGNGPGYLLAAQGGGIQYRGWRNGGNYTTTFADYASGIFSSGDIHQVAIDVDNNDFYYGIANVYQAADAGKDGNPSSGSNPLVADFAFSTNDIVLLAAAYSGTQHWNFGQNGTFNGTKTAQGNSDANGIGNFYYAVPTGYLALCSSNLGAV